MTNTHGNGGNNTGTYCYNICQVFIFAYNLINMQRSTRRITNRRLGARQLKGEMRKSFSTGISRNVLFTLSERLNGTTGKIGIKT